MRPARVVGHVTAGLSPLALLLLLLAGTIGGQFHLSASDEVIAVFLLPMALFGMTSFLWPVTGKRGDTDPDTARPEQG